MAPSARAAVVVVVATSGGFGVLNVAAVSVRQRLTPPGLLGWVTAAWRTMVFGAAAVGALGVVAVALWWLSTRRRPGPLAA